MRRITLGVIAVTSMWSIALVIRSIFSCVPVQGFWDKTIPATCLPNYPRWYIDAAGNIAGDSEWNSQHRAAPCCYIAHRRHHMPSLPLSPSPLCQTTQHPTTQPNTPRPDSPSISNRLYTTSSPLVSERPNHERFYISQAANETRLEQLLSLPCPFRCCGSCSYPARSVSR